MKRTKNLRQFGLLIIMLVSFQSVSALSIDKEKEVIDTINFKVFYGKVVDSNTGNSLPFATVEAIGSNVATVSNIDGTGEQTK